MRPYPVRLLGIGLWALLVIPGIAQIPFDKEQRDRARRMVRDVSEAIRKYYYDAGLHGVDMQARFKTADALIQNATSFGQAFGAIADALDGSNDSHTLFQPPTPPVRREFGYEAQFVANECFVTAVRPNSNATGKLVPGDRLMAFEGIPLTRENYWKIRYMAEIYTLPAVHITVRHADGSDGKVEITAKTKPSHKVFYPAGTDYMFEIRGDDSSERLLRHYHWESGNTMIWKMLEFDRTFDGVDRLVREARKHETLILDLRGNAGGLDKTLEFLVSSFIDHEVTIAKRKGRESDLKSMVAKPHGSSLFRGKLIVLIDSRSAAEAELFTRVVQLEHRGIVLGDRSSGSVMQSRYDPFSKGMDTKIFCGVAITEADLIMADGKSLEHTGVIPDELILPTVVDLASGRDPVLARAAELAGIALDPSSAGQLFPIEWRPD